MTPVEIAFWACLGVVTYTYLVYPLLLALLSRLWRHPVRKLQPAPTSISLLIAARNEAGQIERRLQELTDLLGSSGLQSEILFVSDGSTDDTAEIARRFEGRGVRVLVLPQNEGKAAALTQAAALARYEVLVFADVRQRWAPDALRRLLDNFTDPAVGAVSGDLVLESRPGVLAGVGLYWRLEKWLRRRESLVWSMVGATGAIGAVRRELFRPIPRGTILDDVYWPLCVALQGRRVIHDVRAEAFDRLPERTADEFRRKVRTLSGNFQLLTLLPGALLPWRNPIWLQLVSHKLMRLLVPWALLAMIPLSLGLPHPYGPGVFASQVCVYTLGLLGIFTDAGRRSRLSAAAGSFLVLNGASWCAFWVWASGRAGRSWKQVRYTPSAKSEMQPSC